MVFHNNHQYPFCSKHSIFQRRRKRPCATPLYSSSNSNSNSNTDPYICDDTVESFNMDLLELTMGDAGTIITSSVNHFHNEVDDTTDTATNNLQRAEDVLEIAHELYARGDSRVKPNASSYTTVICGWAYHSNNRKQMREAGERAQRLLDVMEAAYNNKNNDDDDNEDDATVRISSMKPSVLTYSAVAMAWAVQAKSMANSSVSKDRGENAMVKAEQVLDRILELYEAGDEDMVSE